MPSDSLKRFILFIVLPSIMVIVLFIITIFVVILPSTERDIMEGRARRKSVDETLPAPMSTERGVRGSFI